MGLEQAQPVSVLVLGSEGMLGQACMRWLGRSANFRVVGTRYIDRSSPMFFDAEGCLEAPARLFQNGGFAYAINCIGILGSMIVEADAKSVERAIRVNALFPHQLAQAAADCGVKVFHISTDAVFSGATQADYYEDSPEDSLDTYGKSKALGECPAANVLNIRCSIIGRDWDGGKGIIEWFLRADAGATVSGYTDYVWTGTTTFQFAALCQTIMEQGMFDLLRQESHVHHFAPNGALSKYDLLQALETVTRKGVKIRESASPQGPVRRVLRSRFDTVRQLSATQSSWPDVLREALV